MELVYLWVKKYKNIKKQGFNFSPRFECKYNPDDNNLTICNKKKDECQDNDYIENFFGENINVTAIVGKNGSGKSSVLKIIRQIIAQQINDGSFLIFYNKITNKYIPIYTKEKINCELLQQDSIMDSSIIFPLFDYSLTYDSATYLNSEQLPIYPNKDKEVLFFKNEFINNQKNILLNYKDLEQKDKLVLFKDFFQPIKIRILFNLEDMKPYEGEKLKEEAKSRYEDLKENFSTKNIQEALKSIEEIFNILSTNSYYIEKTELFEEVNTIPHLEQELSRVRISSDDFNMSGNTVWEDTSSELFDKNIESEIIKKDNVYNLFTFSIQDLEKNHLLEILESFSISYFTIELIDENGKKLNNLSFGEQQLIFILNQIYSLGVALDQDLYDKIDIGDIVEQGHNLNEIQRYFKLNYIILFDEIDIGFHPDWQKRIVKYIIDFLNLTDDEKHYHLIFTTHSPFLLSDIPKENIIFLNDKSSIKQTFGANIHTLLSDSFFMEDGLMGEFAKNKIQEIMDFLNDKKSIDEISTKEEDIKKVIEAIGEPFLKDKLLKMYYKKFQNEYIKEKRKQELLAQQKRIEEELRRL